VPLCGHHEHHEVAAGTVTPSGRVARENGQVSEASQKVTVAQSPPESQTIAKSFLIGKPRCSLLPTRTHSVAAILLVVLH
jgi:hypothetical protein